MLPQNKNIDDDCRLLLMQLSQLLSWKFYPRQMAIAPGPWPLYQVLQTFLNPATDHVTSGTDRSPALEWMLMSSLGIQDFFCHICFSALGEPDILMPSHPHLRKAKRSVFLTFKLFSSPNFMCFIQAT